MSVDPPTPLGTASPYGQAAVDVNRVLAWDPARGWGRRGAAFVEAGDVVLNCSVGAKGAVSVASWRVPWWGSAVLGMIVIVVLSMPVALSFGNGTGRYFNWYSSSAEQLHTGLILDQAQYLRMVDATAGRAPASEIAPFTSRALAPWLAGKIPLESHVALTVVNLASLMLGTVALARLAMDLTRDRAAVGLAVALWSFSFPVLKYAGDGFVDAAAVGLLPAVLLLIWRRRLLAALPVFAAAVWMKESALVLGVVGIAFAWMDQAATRQRRWLNTAAWLLTAGIAFATAGVPGGPQLVVFAPWLPEAMNTVRDTLSYNLLQIPRLVAFTLTAAPAVFGVIIWWRARRSGSNVLGDSDAVPLVAGCVGGLLLGLSALPTALLDGRSVWTTVPCGALLVAGWWASRSSSAARTEVRSVMRSLRWVVPGAIIVWLAIAFLLPVPVVTPALEDDYEPRFAAVPDTPEEPSTLEFSGRGSSSVGVPAEGPVLLRLHGTEPVGISSDGVELVRGGRVTSGITMMDPESGESGQDSPTLQIDTEGAWRLEVRPISSALYFAVAPLVGAGPNVIVYPGGLQRPLQANWRSDDPGDTVSFVGGCALGTCGQLADDGVIPAGTEALVIDASGDWDISPSEWSVDGVQSVLPGTTASVRPTPE